MVKVQYSGVFRIISFAVLFFFSWTFGGFVDLAYAVKNSSEFGVKSSELKKQKTAEKYNEIFSEMEHILDDSELLACTKTDKLKEKEAKLDELDSEIWKQFMETEKMLKKAGLSQKILKRHHAFVDRYEKNISELKSNIASIGKASTKRELADAVKAAKEHLEKINPPKKHTPVDPEKLPHRTVEPVFKEPRTTPEEFIKEMSAKAGKRDCGEVKYAEGILLASNGMFDGLLSGDMVKREAGERMNYRAFTYSELPSDRIRNAPSYPLSSLPVYAATDPPTSADLEETMEVQFTQAIIDKAAELDNDPLKMYEWVRNNVEYVPTYGSIQGADYCLQTMQCNAFDTASLLIALMRVSNIHARYVEGTAEIPIEKVMNWLGGFTDKMEALNLLASAGIPVTGITAGGEIKYVRMEHIWMEAWIDYFPSRGARHRPGKGEVWIPLDGSFKQYNYTQGIDIQSEVPFDAQTFINQIQATATINEEEGYVTDVDSTYINDTMTDYQTQVEEYITQNYSDATVGEVIGTKEIIPQNFPFLLGTLPYRMLVRGTTYSEIPDDMRHKVTFEVKKDIFDEVNGTPINITKRLPELAGKKITLSYAPASPEDEEVINSYLPDPHEDGTPINPSELPTSLAAYLINLKPELKIDGETIAAGTEVGMGATEEFKMTFTSPGASADIISNDIQAGEYLGIGLDLGRISEGQMTAIKEKLEMTKAMLEAENFAGLTKDDILGDLLHTTAVSYYAELDVMDYVQARTMGVFATRLPSETIFSNEMAVEKFLGVPLNVSAGGLAMDADRIMVMARALDADKDKQKRFMLSSGTNSSALEHSIPEKLFSTLENPAQGISAVKALQIANDQGVPIYTINQSNINSILPQLQTDGGTISDIQNAVHAGKTVTVSQRDITYNGWTGIGYIIIDPLTGDGAYMISGGQSGGILYVLWWLGLILLITAVLVSATILTVAFIAFIGEIISAIIALINVISAIFINLSMLAYIKLPYIADIYNAIVAFEQISPSTGVPIPTTPLELLSFLWIYRTILISRLIKELAFFHFVREKYWVLIRINKVILVNVFKT